MASSFPRWNRSKARKPKTGKKKEQFLHVIIDFTTLRVPATSVMTALFLYHHKVMPLCDAVIFNLQHIKQTDSLVLSDLEYPLVNPSDFVPPRRRQTAWLIVRGNPNALL